MKIITRIYQYIEFKELKPTKFERICGISNGYLAIMLNRNADIGESNLHKIIKNCPDLDVVWLLTGNGNMLNTDLKQTNITVQPIPQDSKTIDELVLSLKEVIVQQKDVIQLLKDKIKTLEMGLEFARTENKSDAVVGYNVLMSAPLPRKLPKQSTK